MNSGKNSAKPLTRNVLEDFTNRCARLDMYEQGSEEYLALRSELDDEACGYRQMSDYEQIVKEDGKEGVKNLLLNYHIVPPLFDKVVDKADEFDVFVCVLTRAASCFLGMETRKLLLPETER